MEEGWRVGETLLRGEIGEVSDQERMEKRGRTNDVGSCLDTPFSLRSRKLRDCKRERYDIDARLVDTLLQTWSLSFTYAFGEYEPIVLPVSSIWNTATLMINLRCQLFN